MKKLAILLLILFLGGIGLYLIQRDSPKIPENGYVKTLIEWTFPYDSFDSLCSSDGIPNNLEYWDTMMVIGDNFKITRPVRQYMYITNNEDTTSAYSIIIHPDSSLFVNKRVTIE